MKRVPFIANSVVVQIVSDRILAFRDRLQSPLPNKLCGHLLVLAKSSQHRLFPKTPKHFQYTVMGTLSGCHQGPAITFKQIGITRVSQDDPIGFIVKFALVYDLDRRNQGAIVEDIRIGGAYASRTRTAQIPEMPERMAIGNQITFIEYRRDKHHIRSMGDTTFGYIRIVVPIEIIRTYSFRRIIPPNAANYVAPQCLSVYFPSKAIQETNCVVLLFSDERRHGGPLDN